MRGRGHGPLNVAAIYRLRTVRRGSISGRTRRWLERLLVDGMFRRIRGGVLGVRTPLIQLLQARLRCGIWLPQTGWRGSLEPWLLTGGLSG